MLLMLIIAIIFYDVQVCFAITTNAHQTSVLAYRSYWQVTCQFLGFGFLFK